MSEPEIKKNPKPKPRITVDYAPGCWGNVYHLFDLDNREISLQKKQAVKLARNILRIAKEQRRTRDYRA